MNIDGKIIFAWLIVCGFVFLTAVGMFHAIPADNVKTIDGAMVALGTALGAAVMALLRSDRVDEQKATNTAKAFEAVTATAQASTPAPVTVAPNADRVNIEAEQRT